MLDNDELILDPYPRELTQNPLKKIWMPYKNGHISQRRGKMQPAGEYRGREAMPVIHLTYQLNLSIRIAVCFGGFGCVNSFYDFIDFTNCAPTKDRWQMRFGSFIFKSRSVCI